VGGSKYRGKKTRPANACRTKKGKEGKKPFWQLTPEKNGEKEAGPGANNELPVNHDSGSENGPGLEGRSGGRADV